MYSDTRSRWRWLTRLPISVCSSAGSPSLMAAVASVNAATTRSWTDASTKIRLRAVQSWPALSKTA